MGSQLRFDPSFFGLALRAAAEADALLFSAHKDLSITRCPTRAGLRLTSPAKASGESDVQKSVHIKKPPRRVPRVGNLPSDEKKVVYPTVVLRLFQQITHLVLDARHEERGKRHVAS